MTTNVFEEDRKKQQLLEAQRKREEKRNAKYKRMLDRYKGQQVYVDRSQPRTDKHANLVRLVVDEQEAARLLTRRKENKDVVAAGPVKRTTEFVGWSKELPKKQTEEEVNYSDFSKPNHITKQWGNA